MFHELRDILAEQGERRVGDDDVRLFQERDALGATEVATWVGVVRFQGFSGGLVALQEELNIINIGRTIAILVFHLVEDDCNGLGLGAIAVALGVFK